MTSRISRTRRWKLPPLQALGRVGEVEVRGRVRGRRGSGCVRWALRCPVVEGRDRGGSNGGRLVGRAVGWAAGRAVGRAGALVEVRVEVRVE
jgi:hypothetical protein